MTRGRPSGAVAVVVFATMLAQACSPVAGRDQQTRDARADAGDKAASDAVAQYKIAKRDGHKVDTCLSAGKVAEAFLKAGDEPQYKTWKRAEERDCKTIGFPF